MLNPGRREDLLEEKFFHPYLSITFWGGAERQMMRRHENAVSYRQSTTKIRNHHHWLLAHEAKIDSNLKKYPSQWVSGESGLTQKYAFLKYPQFLPNKIRKFCQIVALMRTSFWPRFVMIKQKLWILK